MVSALSRFSLYSSRWTLLICLSLAIFVLLLLQPPGYHVTKVGITVPASHDDPAQFAQDGFHPQNESQVINGSLPQNQGSHAESHAESHVANGSHPIEQLWAAGRKTYQEMISRQSKTVDEAITEYTRRYGRLPPQGFSAWVELALQNNFLLIDEFDSLTNQFQLFAKYPPKAISKMVSDAVAGSRGDLIELTIRNSQFTINSRYPDSPICKRFRSMLETHQEYLRLLPDMKLLLNNLDEPNVVVPSSILDSNVAATSTDDHTNTKRARITPIHFVDLAQLPSWIDITLSCPDYPQDQHSHSEPKPALQFITDHSASKDICKYPHYSSMHGMLMLPESLTLTQSLVPIWSQAKLSTFQDILFPSPQYSLMVSDYDHSEDMDWDKKKPSLYWAGSSTGGHATPDNWRQLHRQRLVLSTIQDNNNEEHLVPLLHQHENGTWTTYYNTSTSLQHLFATKITAAVQCDDPACTAQRLAFNLPDPSSFSSSSSSSSSSADTLRDPLSTSHHHKYALDLDGNSFSGRFHRLLHSRSAVIKQSLFREWHDDWLIPWVHYIPLSLDAHELWEMMRWFGGTEDGDRVGREIAEEGARWAGRVLRDVDLDMVVLRELLEYGRLFDEGGGGGK